MTRRSERSVGVRMKPSDNVLRYINDAQLASNDHASTFRRYADAERGLSPQTRTHVGELLAIGYKFTSTLTHKFYI